MGEHLEDREHDPNLIAAYLEGRLREDEKASVTEHLASCAECRGTLALLAREAGGLDMRPPGRVDGSRFRSTKVWLPLAAALVITTVVGLRLAQDTAVPPPMGTTAGASPVSPSPAPPDVRTDRAPSPGRLAASPPAAGVGTESLLLKRGGGQRVVAGKTFRLVAGEWRDTGFDPAAALPIVAVRGSDERSAVLARVPALGPYALLGERVLVVVDGTVYRFQPSAP